MSTPLRIARKAAQGSSFYPYRIGAVLTKGGSVVSVASNKDKTDPHLLSIAKGDNPLVDKLHAECAVIKQVSDAKGTTMHVVRVRKNGSLGLARPCSMCMGHIRKAGIKKVVYSTGTGFYTEKI